MTEQEVLREALEHYINHLALKRNGFYDGLTDISVEVNGIKAGIAEKMLKDSYMPTRLLQVA
jgi:hypothetical protein